MFKIQIFKSPIDGLNYGGRYFLTIFMELFTNFSKYPLEYHRMVPYLGFLIGFLIAIINIVPWIIKVAVTAFDFFYVIVEGFINWGHYE